MKEQYNVCLSKIISDQQLEILCCEKKTEEIFLYGPDINRPGLELAGYADNFANDRVQLLGNVEMQYLYSLQADERDERLESLFKIGFPCMIIARNMEPCENMIPLAEKYEIPVLRTAETTTSFHSELNRYLCVHLAPRITQHACLIEVYGEGVLITGNSGVGKSETALELVKRGHRLVADDIVEIRRVSNKSLVGSAPEIIRHLLEIRGIGFLDVKRLYGVGAVKLTENIQLVVDLERWEAGKEYDRVGIDDLYTEILGIKVPFVKVPVMPGRNLAIIIEVAAMNNRQKMMGYNAAKELNKRVFESKEGLPKEGSFNLEVFS